MDIFRQKVIQCCKERPETKCIYDKVLPFLIPRSDLIEGGAENPALLTMGLGLVYGMLLDLGYR